MSHLEAENQKMETLNHPDHFRNRHIGPNAAETAAMLKAIGFESVDALVDAAVPKAIRLPKMLVLPAPASEFDALRELKSIASQNQVFRSFIGMGYYDTITPRSSSGTSSKTPVGTRNTRPTKRRFPKAASKRS